MSSPYNWRHDFHPPPAEISTSRHFHSENDENVRQQDMHSRRLNQAVNYLAQKGGDDSPATFLKHVDCINKDLLQFLSQQGSAYDSNLYRRVQAMVHEVQRNSQCTAQPCGTLIGDDEDLMEYNAPSPAYALYRAGEAVDAPTAQTSKEQPPLKLGKPALRESVSTSPHHHRDKCDTTYQREKQFKYGGPSNEDENWYADFPASLPFPETFLTQDWESLKIEYDLYRSANQDPKNPTAVFETNIPLDRVRRDRNNDLHRYESGSCFRLPVLSTEVLAMVDRTEIDQMVQKVVEDFNQGNNIETLINDHAPRVFLEKFKTTPSVTKPHDELNEVQFMSDITGTPSPTTVREAVNTTPSKPRPARDSKSNYNTPQRSAAVTPKRVSPAVRRIQRVVDASYNVDCR